MSCWWLDLARVVDGGGNVAVVDGVDGGNVVVVVVSQLLVVGPCKRC